MPVIEKQSSLTKVKDYTVRQKTPNYLYGSPWKADQRVEQDDIKVFIRLKKQFDRQLSEVDGIFDGQSEYTLEEKMKISLNALLDLGPDNISLEVSYDGSVYYKMIFGNYHIFFEHFLIDEFDDSDEAIFTVYEGEERIVNYGGSLSKAINELNKLLVTKSVFEFA
jgi:hypothetical protein